LRALKNGAAQDEKFVHRIIDCFALMPSPTSQTKLMTYSILGALAFAGLMGAQFLAAIVLTSKPADLDPGGPKPRRNADRAPQRPNRPLRSARA